MTAATAGETFILVSDVDDTFKITDVCHSGKALKNLHRDDAFAGMPELYKALLGDDSPAARLTFISGGVVAHTVRELLDQPGFPKYTLAARGVRRFLAGQSVYAFKTAKMTEMYGVACDKFILIGDDTESDADVYETFSSPRRDQILAVYIHRITGCHLNGNNVSFVTAYDIALHERQAGRLTDEQALSIGQKVLNAPEYTFLPSFQACPRTFEPFAHLPDSLSQLEDDINARLATVCKNRPTTVTRCCKQTIK